MLILDKRKAVEHVMALIGTADDRIDGSDVGVDVAQSPKTHARTYQRVAAYERRAAAFIPVPVRRAERRRRRFGHGAESASA